MRRERFVPGENGLTAHPCRHGFLVAAKQGAGVVLGLEESVDDHAFVRGESRRLLLHLAARVHQELIEDAQLVVSELVTNAVVNGARADPDKPVGLVVTAGDSNVRIEVSDCSDYAPELLEPSPEATNGCGLQIVHQLAADHGWHPLPSGGKTVWAVLK